jgi:hypothetical protein
VREERGEVMSHLYTRETQYLSFEECFGCKNNSKDIPKAAREMVIP